ncbi:MAG: hypothetical protein PWP34_2054 [Desulfuromonadales bacterium]|jgi:hypothetical protein|nr:hypothetical protein [Desulfuromonadales bacterium]
MRQQIVWLVAVLTIVMAALSRPSVKDAIAETASPPVDSMLKVSNDVLFGLIDEPEFYLRQALIDLEAGKADATIAALKKVKVFVRLERSRATEPALDKLVDAIIGLDRVAREVRKASSAVTSLSEVAHLTHLALAAHYFQLAQAAWAEKIWQTTGQHLYAAERHIRQGMAWEKHALATEQQTLLRENTVLAEALMDGPGCGNSWAEDVAAPQIAAMGELIEAVMTADE